MLKWCYLFYLEHLQECPIYLLPIILYWDHCKMFWAQKKMVSSNNCPIFSFQKYATSFHSREDLLSPALMLSDFVRTCKGWFRFAAMSRGALFMHLNCDSCSYPIGLLPRWSKPCSYFYSIQGSELAGAAGGLGHERTWPSPDSGLSPQQALSPAWSASRRRALRQRLLLVAQFHGAWSWGTGRWRRGTSRVRGRTGSSLQRRKYGSRCCRFWTCEKIGSWIGHLLELWFSYLLPKWDFWVELWALLEMLLESLSLDIDAII